MAKTAKAEPERKKRALVDRLGEGFTRAAGLCYGPPEKILIGGVDPAPAGFTDDDMVVDVESAREINAMLGDPCEFFRAWPDMIRRMYNLNNLASVLRDEVQDALKVRMLGTWANGWEGRHRTAWLRIANLLISGKLVIPELEAVVAQAREQRGGRLYEAPFILKKLPSEEATRFNTLLNVSRRIPTAREHFRYVCAAITDAESASHGKAVDYGKVLSSIGLTGTVSVSLARQWAELRGCAEEVVDALFDGRLTASKALELVKEAPGKVAQRAAVAALPTEGQATAAVVANVAKAATAAVADAKESGAAAREAAKTEVTKRKPLTLRDLRKLVLNGKGTSAAHKAVRGVLDMLTTPPGDLTPQQIEAVPGLWEYLDETAAPDAE